LSIRVAGRPLVVEKTSNLDDKIALVVEKIPLGVEETPDRVAPSPDRPRKCLKSGPRK